MAKDPTYLKEEFEKQFGTLNASQLWTIVKFAKHVRLRARNNSAFNNLCNSVFTNAKFKTVTKTRKNKYSGVEESYPGLSIVVDNVEHNQDDEES